MADKVISVEITGDASGLVSAAQSARGALSGLSGAQDDAAAAAGRNTESTKENSKSTEDNTGSKENNTKSTKENTKATEENSKKQKTAAQRMAESGKKWKEAGEGIDQVTKPLQYASVAAGALGVVSAKTAIDFEDNFANVKKTVEGTPEQLEEIKQGIIDLTTKGINGHSALPQTTAELTELAAAGGQLGIATENILDFTETMAQMGTATNLSGEAGAATLARFMNVTNTSQEYVSNLGSAVVDLGNNFATTESEIANLALRMGETGGVVGISAQDILGYSTALSSMGIEAEAGGSAVSRIWMTMQKVVAGGGDELEAFAKVSGKSSDEFKKQWKEDASKAFQDFIKGLSKSEDQISLLDELGFGNIRDIAALQALASTKGIDLMTEAIERSNEAWAENTALQTEADAKAQTTAGQMQIAKNNVTEMARSLGEVMLPSIVDVTGGISSFAQKLAGMSDGQKKAIVTGAAVTVGMGALAKGAAGAMKTVGGVAEGMAKIKEVKAAGGAASTLLSVAKGAGIAGLAIAGVTAVVIAGKAAYDKYRESQLNWSEGLYEASEAATQQYDKVKQLNEISAEVKELQLVINSDKSSTEEIEAAKSRLNEITDILEKDYELHISSDNSEIDETLQKLTAAELSKARLNASDLNKTLSEKREDYFSNPAKIRENEKELGVMQDKATRYSNALADVNNALTDFHTLENNYKAEHGDSLFSDDPKLYDKEWKKNIDSINEAIADTDLTPLEYSSANTALVIDKLSEGIEEATKRVNELEDANKKLAASQEEFESSRDSLISAGLSEITFGDEDVGFKDIKTAVEDYGAAVVDASEKAAIAKTGFSELQLAIDNDKLDEVVSNYINYSQELGATNAEILTGAAVIKNGFENIEQATAAGDEAINNIIQDMKLLGEQNGMFEGMDDNGIAEKLTDMAHAMELIPKNEKISFDVDTNGFEVVNITAEALKNINKNSDIKLKINALGDIEVIKTADENLKELAKNNKVDIIFNVNKDNFGIFDKKGKQLGTIEMDGTVTWKDDTSEPDNYTPEEKDGKVVFKADFTQLPTEAPSIPGKVIFGTNLANIKAKATGTNFFDGGLAMVNDQRGISDPRELIVDKGRAFIPEGKDVVLPLSKGAKVYTASQTKQIMSGIGIPHYAGGKNNSDAFTNAVNDYSHYTSTHAVSVSDQLEKWNKLLKETAQTDKDVWDAEEKIYSLRQKQYQEQLSHSESWLTHEQKYNALGYDDTVAAIRRIEARVQEAYDNGLMTEREYLDTMQKWNEKYLDEYISMQKKLHSESESYISLHAYRNDWDAVGDDPISAYNRVKDREKDLLDQGLEDWDTYYGNLNSLSETMLDDRISQSEEWLSMQKQYYSMNTSEYIAGLDRMLDYTNEYYDKLEISDKKYTEVTNKLLKERMDAQRQLYDDWEKSADNYYKIRETFDDWEKVGDSKSRFYLGSLAQIEKHYRDGNLSWQDYMDESMEKYLSLYEAVSDEYADKLQDISDEMDEVSKEYAAARSNLTKEYEQKNRDKDLAEVNRLLDIYQNAVTDAGQQKYKDLLEQKEQLLYQQKLADLEEDEQDAIADLQDSYDAVEAEKQRTLDALRTDSFNIFGKVSDMNIDTSAIKTLAGAIGNTVVANALTNAKALDNSATLVNAVSQIVEKLGTLIKLSGTSNVYNNNGTYHIASDASAIERLTNTIVSGLGSVMIG